MSLDFLELFGQRWPLNELHYQRTNPVGLLESVNLRDVGMVQRGERLRLSREPGVSVAVVGKGLW